MYRSINIVSFVCSLRQDVFARNSRVYANTATRRANVQCRLINCVNARQCACVICAATAATTRTSHTRHTLRLEIHHRARARVCTSRMACTQARARPSDKARACVCKVNRRGSHHARLSRCVCITAVHI